MTNRKKAWVSAVGIPLNLSFTNLKAPPALLHRIFWSASVGPGHRVSPPSARRRCAALWPGGHYFGLRRAHGQWLPCRPLAQTPPRRHCCLWLFGCAIWLIPTGFWLSGAPLFVRPSGKRPRRFGTAFFLVRNCHPLGRCALPLCRARPRSLAARHSAPGETRRAEPGLPVNGSRVTSNMLTLEPYISWLKEIMGLKILASAISHIRCQRRRGRSPWLRP